MNPSSPPPPVQPAYAIAEKTLQRWVKERVCREPRAGGGVDYVFRLSGSTCSNMGLPIETLMLVSVEAGGRIVAAEARVAPADTGCDAMCASEKVGARFLAEMGGAGEAVGLTLAEAAFRDWAVEPSGCFCSAGNRRHKWRNVFQTLHYAATRGGA